MLKKTVASLFTLALLFSILKVPSNAVGLSSGECGADGGNVTWYIDGAGTLVISGTGAMRDYWSWTSDTAAPWTESNVKKAIIEDGVTYVGNGAFAHCSTLTSVSISASVTGMGEYVFFETEGLVSISVDIDNPTFVTDNGVLFSKDKTAIICYPAEKAGAEYTIPNGVITVGPYSFRFNSYLRKVTIPETVTSIERLAFSNCRNLVAINIPSGITVIQEGTFLHCGFTDFEFPDGVTAIGEMAFSECPNIRSFTIPVTVSKIGEMAFFRCYELSDIYYGGSESQWGDVNVGYYNHFNEPFTANGDFYPVTFHWNTPTSTGTPIDQVKSNTPSSWAQTEVTAAIGAGLVPVELQQNYTQPVSRGKVARMFVNLIEQSSGKPIATVMTEKGVAPNYGAFIDTTDDAVIAANALGIINGVGGNRFDPDGTLTRAQIAAIINRGANVLGINTSGYQHGFTDVSGHWVDSELGWPVYAGIINGVGDNRFDPNSPLTVEQSIAITYRALTALKP